MIYVLNIDNTEFSLLTLLFLHSAREVYTTLHFYTTQ